MELLREIKDKFASGDFQFNWRKVQSLPSNYPGFVYKDFTGYGVAIPFDFKEEFKVKYNNCKIFTKIINVDDKELSLLCLGSNNLNIKNEFAVFCTQFLELGDNYQNRLSLLEDPIKWAENWSDLMGNTVSCKQPYSVLAELIVFSYLLKQGKKVSWTAAINGTNDLESAEESFEVKSTISRHSNTVTISSEYQLNTHKKLFLYYCKLEKSPTGKSINDLVLELINLGVNKEALEKRLNALDLEEGLKVRNTKYKTLEKRCYPIDSDFPKITEESFINGKKPLGIGHIVYDLDLDVIKNYTTW